jgi:predicted secreted hydrolase
VSGLVRRVRSLGTLIVFAAAVAGCAGSPVLANPPVVRPSPASPTPAPTPPKDPVAVRFPADDAPHPRLTEWWYVTGHLTAAGGRDFGYEFVVFRAERGAFPVTWASHLALTDESGRRFLYAQRSDIGPQVDTRAATPGADFAFALAGTAALGAGDTPAPRPDGAPWRMTRVDGVGRLAATASASEVAVGGAPSGGGAAAPGFGLDLTLSDAPPVLHGANGWLDFGPAGGSYYYSRTRQAARGTVLVGGTRYSVDGIAWFDHQWGDFISVGAGGWDWFAVNLDDRTDLTLSLIRAADGSYPLVYGTLVRPNGRVEHLSAASFRVEPTGRWTSPRTGATYPAGWRVTLPAERLVIDLTPTVPGQELDTRPTTGVTYWEGSQVVRATRAGKAVGGEAYVELTGYGPSG